MNDCMSLGGEACQACVPSPRSMLSGRAPSQLIVFASSISRQAATPPGARLKLGGCVAEGAREQRADRWLIGGDFAVFGGWPRETVVARCELPSAARALTFEHPIT